MNNENFLQELTALSKKHGLYIRARHEDDWWYAPLLIDSEIGSGAKVVLEGLTWNEKEKKYDGDPITGKDNAKFI